MISTLALVWSSHSPCDISFTFLCSSLLTYMTFVHNIAAFPHDWIVFGIFCHVILFLLCILQNTTRKKEQLLQIPVCHVCIHLQLLRGDILMHIQGSHHEVPNRLNCWALTNEIETLAVRHSWDPASWFPYREDRKVSQSGSPPRFVAPHFSVLFTLFLSIFFYSFFQVKHLY